MNRPKQIGTAAETAVVRYLAANGFPHAERRALRGVLDAGDVTGCPGLCVEVKGGDAARNASDLVIAAWMQELAVEIGHAQANVGLLVVQRAGVGPANAGRWWAYMTSAQHANLTGDPYPTTGRFGFPVRLLLADAVSLLRAAGYGQPADPNACVDPTHPAGSTCPVCHDDGTGTIAIPPVTPPRPLTTRRHP